MSTVTTTTTEIVVNITDKEGHNKISGNMLQKDIAEIESNVILDGLLSVSCGDKEKCRKDVNPEEEVAIQNKAKVMIMKAAAASALTGVTLKHGGPFGACVVRDGIFISVAHNTVLMDKDPTCHAEMNAIRYACEVLDTHDLSECELFTTCEPCPMCWGGIQWSRLKKVYTGVDRHTAAKYGFDDKVFYDELNAQSGHYAVKIGKTMPSLEPTMLEVYPGVEEARIARFVGDVKVNKTFRRRAGAKKNRIS